jgi:hypothetical protein
MKRGKRVKLRERQNVTDGGHHSATRMPTPWSKLESKVTEIINYFVRPIRQERKNDFSMYIF